MAFLDLSPATTFLLLNILILTLATFVKDKHALQRLIWPQRYYNGITKLDFARYTCCTYLGWFTFPVVMNGALFASLNPKDSFWHTVLKHAPVYGKGNYHDPCNTFRLSLRTVTKNTAHPSAIAINEEAPSLKNMLKVLIASEFKSLGFFLILDTLARPTHNLHLGFLLPLTFKLLAYLASLIVFPRNGLRFDKSTSEKDQKSSVYTSYDPDLGYVAISAPEIHLQQFGLSKPTPKRGVYGSITPLFYPWNVIKPPLAIIFMTTLVIQHFSLLVLFITYSDFAHPWDDFTPWTWIIAQLFGLVCTAVGEAAVGEADFSRTEGVIGKAFEKSEYVVLMGRRGFGVEARLVAEVVEGQQGVEKAMRGFKDAISKDAEQDGAVVEKPTQPKPMVSDSLSSVAKSYLARMDCMERDLQEMQAIVEKIEKDHAKMEHLEKSVQEMHAIVERIEKEHAEFLVEHILKKENEGDHGDRATVGTTFDQGDIKATKTRSDVVPETSIPTFLASSMGSLDKVTNGVGAPVKNRSMPEIKLKSAKNIDELIHQANAQVAKT